MLRARTLVIELNRLERPNEPYAFDGKPQQYFARDSQGKSGVAVLRWDELEALRAEFQHPVPPLVVQRRMGDLLRRFLEEELRELEGWKSYEDALLEAEARGTPIRLLFRFGAGELFSLPWSLTELGNGRHLGSISPHPLRFEWAHDTVDPQVSPSHGRVLFAWSDAEGDVAEERHLDALRRACPEFNRERDELENWAWTRSARNWRGRARRERPFASSISYVMGACFPVGLSGCCGRIPIGLGSPRALMEAASATCWARISETCKPWC